VKRAIIIHRQDFAAIIALVLGAVVVAGYILLHQPAFTLFKSYYTVRAQFSSAAAVTSGQGQTVDIAGVEVGQIGGITEQDGHAVVTMNIYKKYAPIYNNATVLLRPRTPLQDMYLALDPGTKSAGAVPAGGMLGVASTQPDINTDQILDSLDADTRNYLLLLLAGGAQLFQNPSNPDAGGVNEEAVDSLRGTFKRFAPLNRDTRTLTSLLSQRSYEISHSINGLQKVTRALGGVDGQLTQLIEASNTNFQAISSQDAALESALTLLPGTLQETSNTLTKVTAFSNASTTALHGLLPFAHAFAPALEAARPLFEDTVSTIKDQLRPFSVGVQPVARVLAPATAKLAVATPKLSDSISVLNDLFNTLAYTAKGSQSYLFWGSWLSHIAASLTDLQDAQGPTVRGVFMASCSELDLFETALRGSNPALGPLIDLLNPPNYAVIKSKYCPATGGPP
jgi:phospholipid/cholesterol/gamma-HCH transport system substrate-binding protein